MTINMPLSFCSLAYKILNTQEKECKAPAFISSRDMEKKFAWAYCIYQSVGVLFGTNGRLLFLE